MTLPSNMLEIGLCMSAELEKIISKDTSESTSFHGSIEAAHLPWPHSGLHTPSLEQKRNRKIF